MRAELLQLGPGQERSIEVGTWDEEPSALVEVGSRNEFRPGDGKVVLIDLFALAGQLLVKFGRRVQRVGQLVAVHHQR
ncbi:hypothetical protein D9M73_287580 [compost metagenome]